MSVGAEPLETVGSGRTPSLGLRPVSEVFGSLESVLFVITPPFAEGWVPSTPESGGTMTQAVLGGGGGGDPSGGGQAVWAAEAVRPAGAAQPVVCCSHLLEAVGVGLSVGL
jgi:hypothetical protein